MSAIAIDFGNSNTVVARWQAISNQPETLKLPSISRTAPYDFLIPSLLYLKDAKEPRTLIGQQVIDSATTESRLFDQIKRHLSTSTGFIPEVDGIKVSSETIGNLFLNQLFDNLRSQQISFSEVIFTVPVQTYERYLYWLETFSRNCLERSDIEFGTPKRIRTLDEPTAAALGYKVDRPSSIVLAIDFGGGTLDLALVRTPRHANPADWGNYVGETEFEQSERQVEVIAKTGQIIGGEDINQWLVEDFSEQHDIEIANSGHLLFALMERIKINLSQADTATEVYFDPNRQDCYDITYSRSQLEYLLRRRGFYRVLQTAIDEVVNRAASKGILKMDIKNILLVGGSTLIPSVREIICKAFPNSTIHSDKPFEAVAHGALMLNRGVRVKDYLFHSYAIRYWHGQLQQWQYQTLFLRGQTYPTVKPSELILRASQPNQIRIELVIGELEKRPVGSAEVIFNGDRLVTTIENQATEVFSPLVDADTPQAIAHLEPLGQPGSDRLKVLFSISDRRQLLVTVIDLETQATLLTNQAVAELR